MTVISIVAPLLCVAIAYLVFAGYPTRGVQTAGGLSYTKYMRECTHEIHTDIKTGNGELLRSIDTRMRVRLSGRSVSIELDGKLTAGVLTESGVEFGVRPVGLWNEQAARDALAMHFEHIETRPQVSGWYELVSSGASYEVHADASPGLAVSTASSVDDYTGMSHTMHWKTKLDDRGRVVEAEVRSLSHVPIVGNDTTLTFDTRDNAKCKYIKHIGTRGDDALPDALALAAPRFLLLEAGVATARLTRNQETLTASSSIRTRRSEYVTNGFETRGNLRGEIVLGKQIDLEIVHESKNSSDAQPRAIASHIHHKDLVDVGLYARVEGIEDGINTTFSATRAARIPAHALVHHLEVDIMYDFTSTEVVTLNGFEIISQLKIQSGNSSDVEIDGVVYNATISVDGSTRECTVSRMVQDATAVRHLIMRVNNGAGATVSLDTTLMNVAMQDDYCDAQQIVVCEHEFVHDDEEGDEPVEVKTKVVEVRVIVATPSVPQLCLAFVCLRASERACVCVCVCVCMCVCVM